MIDRKERRFVPVLLVMCSAFAAFAQNAADSKQASASDLQKMIDAAKSNSVVQCDPNQQWTLSTPVKIQKPLTLLGLHARLPEKLGSTPLLIVEAKGVTVADFELVGNADSVPQKDRSPLLIIAAGDFRVERGHFINSSKDGVMIDGDGAKQDI